MKFMRLARVLSIGTAVALLIGAGAVLAQTVSSTNFIIQSSPLKKGAGFSTSSNFRLWGALGEGAIGFSTATGFQINSGFLYIPSALITQTPGSGGSSTSTTPNPVIVVAGGGGGIFYPRVRAIVGFERADFNHDGLVNIIDLSIILYYYNDTGSLIKSYDLSGDGKIDISDISILLYYWTG